MEANHRTVSRREPAGKLSSTTTCEWFAGSFGESEYDAGGSIVGNKRTFVLSSEVEGKPVKLRYTEVQMSPTFFTYQAEASVDGGPWTVIAEGKVTRVE